MTCECAACRRYRLRAVACEVFIFSCAAFLLGACWALLGGR